MNKENKIKKIIENKFKNGYSYTDTIIKIMYVLFPEVDLIYNDKEFKQAETIYNNYVNEI